MVVDRRRIELVEDEWAKQPYHAAADLKPDAARDVVDRGVEAAHRHEFYLMCDDVEAFVAEMREHHIACAPVRDQGYGLVTRVTLPGGGTLGVYQPRHARPKPMRTPPRPKRAGRPKTRRTTR